MENTIAFKQQLDTSLQQSSCWLFCCVSISGTPDQTRK